MASFQGKRVSGKWAVVLRWAEKQGVRFSLTSGQRTMADQWRLYRVFQSGGNLAAFPSPLAPHIRKGFSNHALDVNSLDGGETRLERWVESKGVDWKNTVPGESWHGEISRAGLNKLYKMAKKAMADPLKGYRADEKRWIREYDDLNRLKKRTAKQSTRRNALRRAMAKRRKGIWRAAERRKGAWDKYRRRDRYRSLRARS